MNKQEILEEIKRTAKENKGKPLGRERFEKETGFKMTDWYPYLWLRWSDALIEAGFTPNKLSAPVDKDLAIKMLVGLIQELGRYPVSGEFRLKAKQDSTFPSHTVFDKFGGKSKVASAVVSYCQKHGGLDSIIEICAPLITKDESLATFGEILSTTEISGGFVYLMKHGQYYKIGRTDEIGRRHRELKTQMPEDIEVVHSFRTDDPSGIEAYWHKRFANKRKNGEWFDLTRSDINAFKLRKRFM